MNELNIKHLSFTKRPISVPADYRPNYKIAQVCLTLKYSCIGNKSGLLKLHLFSWAFKRIENRKVLLSFVESNFKTDFSVWGIEPTLNRALQIATAEKYCSYSKGTYKLEEKGFMFCDKIEEDEEILFDEISLLKKIGKKKITDKKLKELTNQWTLFND
ncbi:hypothetical protein L3073_07865 [Ancylomarina sp. DW003]|nr:hypothetical protein [Ancylomarina sp. DW003]MDE5422121.1 hypothetical protein [Ancylomarina sp. DW003]